ncbi:DUF4412 domain-containing protein [Lewinella sp. W8]|uniref:DUF4412 domain-containing protein n=1 Tax=Lewinella sp. W8 TaxID=2528208 RepID=UPI0010674FA2|nr:DUF4412 domain-containing protein [Lewinella sp. W8]MTB52716.1 DUF4412 domain-containing protein [Lewinella sp. W8]
MKLRLLFSLALAICCLTLTAQTSERVKNRAEHRANSHVDRQVDRAVDGAVNAIGGLFKKKRKKNTEEAPADQPFTQEAPAPQSSTTAFEQGEWEPFTNPTPFSLLITTKEIKKNGKESTATMRMAVTEELFGLEMASDQASEATSRMIFNTQTGKTTLVTTDKKGEQSAFRMRVPKLNKSRLWDMEDMEERFSITATGERKVINGYNCEKYIVKDLEEGTTTTSWITKDVGMNAQDVFSNFANMAGAGKNNLPSPEKFAAAYEGFPIESTTTDGKTTFIMTFTDIKIGADKMDKKVLDLTGVEVQDMGF